MRKGPDAIANPAQRRWELDAKVEKYLNDFLKRNDVDSTIDFQVSDAVQKLVQCKVLAVDDDGDGQPDKVVRKTAAPCRFSK